MPRPEHQLPAATSAAQAFGTLLRAERRARGLTQTRLAEIAECSPATVGQLERARFLPSADLLAGLERALGGEGALEYLWTQAVLQSHAHRAPRGDR